jgi:hypothetical protein
VFKPKGTCSAPFAQTIRDRRGPKLERRVPQAATALSGQAGADLASRDACVYLPSGRIAVGLLISSLASNGTKEPQVRDESHPAPSASPPRSNACSDVPAAADLKRLLQAAPAQGDAGGLNHGKAIPCSPVRLKTALLYSRPRTRLNGARLN